MVDFEVTSNLNATEHIQVQTPPTDPPTEDEPKRPVEDASQLLPTDPPVWCINFSLLSSLCLIFPLCLLNSAYSHRDVVMEQWLDFYFCLLYLISHPNAVTEHLL